MPCSWVDQPLQSLHKSHLEGPWDETPVDVDPAILLHRCMIPLAKYLLDGMNSEQGMVKVLVLKTKNICYQILLGEAGDRLKRKAYCGD